MNPRPLSPAHRIPRRRLTAYDLVILFGVPLVAHLGAAAAAAGFVEGVVLAAFAALAALTFRATESGRSGARHVAGWTRFASIAASVVIVLVAWNLFRTAPHTPLVAWGWPLVAVAAFLASAALLLARRGR